MKLIYFKPSLLYFILYCSFRIFPAVKIRTHVIFELCRVYAPSYLFYWSGWAGEAPQTDGGSYWPSRHSPTISDTKGGYLSWAPLSWAPLPWVFHSCASLPWVPLLSSYCVSWMKLMNYFFLMSSFLWVRSMSSLLYDLQFSSSSLSFFYMVFIFCILRCLSMISYCKNYNQIFKKLCFNTIFSNISSEFKKVNTIKKWEIQKGKTALRKNFFRLHVVFIEKTYFF